MIEIDRPAFEASLAEAANWCESRFAEATRDCLRSSVLRPTRLFMAANHEKDAVAQSSVQQVVAKRHGLLLGTPLRAPASLGGRVLSLDLKDNLFHGLAMEGTNGFFDEQDMPAWDSWVAYYEPVLLVYIPRALVKRTQREAISTCPTNSFRWAATDKEHPLLRELQKRLPLF